MTPALRLRTGALVVLVGWAILLVGGAAFAKASEHFSSARPAGCADLARGAYGAVVALALVCGVLVLIGAAVALPATVRFLRGGGWPAVRRRVLVAVLAVIGTADPPRSGSARGPTTSTSTPATAAMPLYSVAFLAWGALVAVTLGLVIAAASHWPAGSRSPRAVLRIEGCTGPGGRGAGGRRHRGDRTVVGGHGPRGPLVPRRHPAGHLAVTCDRAAGAGRGLRWCWPPWSPATGRCGPLGPLPAV